MSSSWATVRSGQSFLLLTPVTELQDGSFLERNLGEIEDKAERVK